MSEWRSLDWLPGYEISECGDVRRTQSKRNYKAGRLLKGQVTRKGYVRFYFPWPGKHGRQFSAHRLVCEAFNGPAPSAEHTHVAHNDGNPRNNHFSNLRWATPQENEADRQVHGTRPIGERNHRAKLTEEAVRQIRSEYRGQRQQLEDFAVRYGVCVATIKHCLYGLSWRGVGGPQYAVQRKTHCLRGHELAGNQTSRGQCRSCIAVRRQERRAA